MEIKNKDMEIKYLSQGYQKRFSDLTYQLVLKFNKLIEEHVKEEPESEKEPGIVYGPVIYALSQMINIIILSISTQYEDKIEEQNIIKVFHNFAHKILDNNLEKMMEELTKNK